MTNNSPTAGANSGDKSRVVIFDTTLRDGEQSPGATMTHDEKLEIAGLLDDMGVDIIEAGFPIASEGDFRAVSEIAERSKNSVICGLARASFKDIDRCAEAVRKAAQPRIHTFIGTSALHRAIPNLTMDEMADKIHETVTHARNLVDNVQWSPMDATRTEWDYLCRVIEIAIKAGATTINIPDTVGYTAPMESADLIKRLIETVPGADEVIFATHCHNDLGMATANALAAVAGGARQIECTINGLGERAGNTALEEVVMALKTRNDIMPWHTGIDTTKIMHISRRVSTVSGFVVQPNKAIVGKNAFAHESGIHQDGMLKNRENFEIMRPEDVGLSGTSLPLGKHSGRAALRDKLEHLGYEVGDNQLKDVFVRFKELADRKKEVFDDDLIALMRTGVDAENDYLKIVSMKVVCGTGGPAESTVEMEIDGKDVTETAEGDGPVDATFKAIRMIHPNSARLQLYQVHAVTEGTDAQATVSVRLEEDGIIATGESANTDTVVASAKAYVNALNRLIVRRGRVGEGADTREISYKDLA
ncbi:MULTISPECIES: 2-isopropylmalate synthase [unclassified Leisingera]|uniref:2-isopropylmalate synthase n=1 Tax=unclassified Leisingera TaxID=2614906 RepID=UPI001010659A|nr:MULTISPECIES: 2-isopropylmalate synthase [unclassified Leisingera]MBQ4825201.1 2-isopropylmalate synthase [Leisingera sp. HS039]MCF6430224.1 2-isopropylmalate synthase [Leisingera sp. MMG026]QAX28272.1 2-isopropylmalate synthase [Leisingera sp. NJS204]QBR35046.1 2-isopropylmalate synthase [Leisingera sp. NJS201]